MLGYGQADAFADAAARVGLAITVPSQRELSQAKLDEARLRDAGPDDLAEVARQLGADTPLLGDMTFSDAAGGWLVTWRFLWRGAEHRWQVSGVNFDAAFLNGMRGVAQIASQHGSP
jgi:hypothetical protein